jgi:aminoglycoside 3-N-acetyltransferase
MCCWKGRSKVPFQDISNFLIEKTKDNPASIHIDLIGLIRLGKSQDEMMDNFYKILMDTQEGGGNIVVPNYTYSLTKNEVFDLNSTPPTIGKVCEYLSKTGVSRTQDGNFSYLNFSNHFFQEHLQKIESYETFGENSLIDELFESDGYLCALGCGLEFTEIHYIEKKLNVPYRFNKKFTGKINNGVDEYVQDNTYFCRDTSLGLRSNFDALYGDLKKEGLIEYWSIDNIFEVEAIKFRELYTFIKSKLKKNRNYLVSSYV